MNSQKSSLAYRGRHVVVAGGGGTCKGAAVVRAVRASSGDVTVLDLREPADGTRFVEVDLGDPAAIDSAIDQLADRVRPA